VIITAVWPGAVRSAEGLHASRDSLQGGPPGTPCPGSWRLCPCAMPPGALARPRSPRSSSRGWPRAPALVALARRGRSVGRTARHGLLHPPASGSPSRRWPHPAGCRLARLWRLAGRPAAACAARPWAAPEGCGVGRTVAVGDHKPNRGPAPAREAAGAREAPTAGAAARQRVVVCGGGHRPLLSPAQQLAEQARDAADAA
jgi:hypothetical protein